MAITYGNVPKPNIESRIIPNSQAIEGHGWDDLGKRNPKFIALHRMVGTLWGTDGWFRRPDVASLTDFGIGIASVDGIANAGRIMQWNDYKGDRSGWASGRVSSPYGDGLKIVNKYGINAVNRDGVSIEVSGTNEPIDSTSWNALVHLCAYLADEMKIPYTSLPLNPHTGINLLIWHQEFTIGTGKKCPFQWLMDNTDRLYKDIAAFLKPYQEAGSKPTPEPTPEPDPKGKTITVRFEVPFRTSPGFYDYEWKNEKGEKVGRSNINQKRPTLPAGTKGELIDGPRESDGVTFYDIKLPNGETGWIQDQVLHALSID